MKPLLKLINTQNDYIYQIMRVDEPYFFPHWHFHPEYEIMLVLEGTGIRFVGDSMERFKAGDLVFIGEGIPHIFRSDKEYYDSDSKKNSKAIVIYFNHDFLGHGFWNDKNIHSLKKLFSVARSGIKFNGKSRGKITRKILELDDLDDGLVKIIDLLQILKIMSEATEYDILSSDGFNETITEDDCERINKVYQFVMDNYVDNPTLEEVANIACLSPTAFCRFFKSHTNKTYVQFLNEIKIGNACKLLIDQDYCIAQVCYSTGYNNTTHFNNQFKKIIGMTPSEYKNKHHEVLHIREPEIKLNGSY